MNEPPPIRSVRGKDSLFAERGGIPLKGFEEPVRPAPGQDDAPSAGP